MTTVFKPIFYEEQLLEQHRQKEEAERLKREKQQQELETQKKLQELKKKSEQQHLNLSSPSPKILVRKEKTIETKPSPLLNTANQQNNNNNIPEQKIVAPKIHPQKQPETQKIEGSFPSKIEQAAKILQFD